MRETQKLHLCSFPHPVKQLRHITALKLYLKIDSLKCFISSITMFLDNMSHQRYMLELCRLVCTSFGRDLCTYLDTNVNGCICVWGGIYKCFLFCTHLFYCVYCQWSERQGDSHSCSQQQYHGHQSETRKSRRDGNDLCLLIVCVLYTWWVWFWPFCSFVLSSCILRINYNRPVAYKRWNVLSWLLPVTSMLDAVVGVRSLYKT